MFGCQLTPPSATGTAISPLTVPNAFVWIVVGRATTSVPFWSIGPRASSTDERGRGRGRRRVRVGGGEVLRRVLGLRFGVQLRVHRVVIPRGPRRAETLNRVPLVGAAGDRGSGDEGEQADDRKRDEE